MKCLAPLDPSRVSACMQACAGIPTEELQIIADGGETFVDTHKRLQAQVDALTGAKIYPLPREGHHLVIIRTGTLSPFNRSNQLEAFRNLVGKAKAEGRTNAMFTLISYEAAQDLEFKDFSAGALKPHGLAPRDDFDRVLRALKAMVTPSVERSPEEWHKAKKEARRLVREFGGDL